MIQKRYDMKQEISVVSVEDFIESNLKSCPKCGVKKDISLFGKDPYTKDGVRPTCKKCRNKTAKEYYLKRKQYYKEYHLTVRGESIAERIAGMLKDFDSQKKFQILKEVESIIVNDCLL